MPRSSLEPPVEAGPTPTGPEPNLHKLSTALRDRVEVRSLAITGLFVLAAFYTLYFARAFFLPVVFAILLDFLFSPVLRILKRGRIPEPVGAALVILGLLGFVGAGAYSLAQPARSWVSRAPASMEQIRGKLRLIRRPVQEVSRAAEQVEKAARAPASESGPAEVVVKGPTAAERLFGTTQTIVIGAIEVLILLYFLLAAGDLFLQKMINVLPSFGDKRRAVEIARETEASISTYLVTLTLLNVGEALAVTGAMYLVGVPNPLLWGVLAGLVEFIPYIGPTVLLLVLAAAGLTTFDTLGHALLVPGAYLVVNFVQSNLVSPLIMGQRLTLNPVAIFIGLAFWWWIWGVPGAFIAVPLLATLKIFCDHIETLAPIGEFLGR
ncbi:MAG TPA: AI-2E family transporter [Gemmatimonadales bacterium]|nr:AI-2E family transporter [Gemmatimonadales bacterium]